MKLHETEHRLADTQGKMARQATESDEKDVEISRLRRESEELANKNKSLN